jgi:DNA-binding ferritin-like protein
MKCGEYIGELFRARDILHIEHLLATDMAAHVVLEELYDDILDHADAIAEMRLYRGDVDIIIPGVLKRVNAVTYLEEELLPKTDKAKEHAESKGMNDIAAEIDNVKVTLTKKLYKLKRLTDEYREAGDKKEKQATSSNGYEVDENGIVEYK